MARDTAHIRLDLIRGLDQKVDSRLNEPTTLLKFENAFSNKLGRIQKKFGSIRLGSSFIGASTGTITSGLGLSKFNDELVLFGNNRALTYSPTNDFWIDKGTILPATITQESIVRNNDSQSSYDMIVHRGIVCAAWEDSLGGVRAVVFDDTSKAPFQTNVIISATGTVPRVIGIGNYIYVFYVESASTALRYQRLAIGNPTSFGSATDVVTDMNATNSFYDAKPLLTHLVIAYRDSSDEIAVTYFREDGTVGSPANGLPAAFTIVEEPSTGLALTTFNNGGIDYLALGWHNSTNGIRAAIYDQGFNSTVATSTLDSDTTSIANITASVNNADNDTIRYFWEYRNSPVIDTLIEENTLTLAGAVGTSGVFARSVGLLAQAFFGAGTVLVPVTHGATIQTSSFVLDSVGDVIARVVPGEAAALHVKAHLARITDQGNDKFTFPNGIKGQFIVENNQFFTAEGVARTTLDLGTECFCGTANLGKNLHIAGGLVYDYDGESLIEDNFHLFPEIIDLAEHEFVITVTQQGDNSPARAEITDITIPDGRAIPDGTTLLLYSANDATVYGFHARVDGSTTTPAIPGVDVFVPVAILSTDGADTVAEAVRTAVDAQADFTAVRTAATITVTNAATGPATDANVFGLSFFGLPALGTFSYVAVYEWDDNQGQRHRSTPSLPLSITLTGTNDIVSAKVSTLRLTRKTGERRNITVYLYRTENGGSLFYKGSVEIPNDVTKDFIFIPNLDTDVGLVSQEPLYTTGGVLPNFAPPAAIQVEEHEQRIWLISAENRNVLYYSKRHGKGLETEFVETQFIEVEPTGGEITAIKSLDQNLIIFKRDNIFVLTGEGPDPTGFNNTFSEPQEIQTDVGCTNARSLVRTPAGIMFESAKGIYSLDRALRVLPIGRNVQDLNSLTITDAVLLDDENEVRFMTSEGTTIVYNYIFDQWGSHLKQPAIAAISQQGEFHRLQTDGAVLREDKTIFKDDNLFYPMRIRTGWFRAQDLGLQRVISAAFLGEFKGHHKLRIKVFTDESEGPVQTVIFDTKTTLAPGNFYYGDHSAYGEQSPYGGNFDSRYLFRLFLKRQRSDSISFEIEDIPDQDAAGESLTITQIVLEAKPKNAKRPKLPKRLNV